MNQQPAVQLRTLSTGLSGDDVRHLHALMLDHGASIDGEELVAGFFGAATHRALIALQGELGRLRTGVADIETTDALLGQDRARHGYVVGRVLGPDERPVPGVQVRAFDRDLRSEQALGHGQADEHGFFLVRYEPERATADEVRTADVFVRAFVGERVVHQTPMAETRFNAGSLVSVTLRLTAAVPPDETEYERVLSLIEPARGDVGWADLVEDERNQDVTFLAGETELTEDQVSWMTLAHRLEEASKVPAYFFYAIFAAHALAAVQHWTSLTPRLHLTVAAETEPLLYDVALLPEAEVERTVKAAVAEYVVPARLSDELPEIVERLAEISKRARRWAQGQRRRVLDEHVAHLITSDVRAHLDAVLAADPFGDLPGVLGQLVGLELVPSGEQTDEARAGLSLREVLGDDRALIDAVQERHGISGAEDVHRLAELTADDWAQVAAPDGAPEPGPTGVPGATMAARMAARYPTTAFAARLRSDLESPIPHATAVADVLAAHPEFDLATGNVGHLLAAHDQEVAEQPAASLRTAQRVFRLAPSYEHARALIDDGLSSAAAVVRRGKQRFLRDSVQAGVLTAPEALETFRKAADVHATSLMLAGQLYSASAAMMLPALASAPLDLDPVVKDFPNMKSLFATIDMVQCDDCRSVHGAAAYLVEVLQFLGERLVVDTTTSPALSFKGARDELLARRPDLVVTDLNCPNTNTSIPYLDAVCELLEEAVAPQSGVPYTGSLAAGVITTDLLTALTGADLAFTDAAIVYGPDGDGGYVARDKQGVVGITPDGADWRIKVLRQTFGTDEELAAAPQYLSPEAYTRLAAANWCFTLPFDLAHQETRRYIAQFDIDRSTLMRLLQVSGTPTDAAIAAEALGLSDGQRTLVASADLAGQQDIWNTPATPASGTLANVDAFVTRAGISYQDLLELLDLGWIDAGQDLFVQHLDSSADLAQKRIANLDDSGLDRLHRFLRLRTATGWSSATLDRAIRSSAGGKGTLDNSCLVACNSLREAATRLSMSVDEVIDVLEPLDIDNAWGLYASTFLDQVRVGDVDPRFAPAAVHANEAAELAVQGSGVTLSAVVDFLGLALGLSAVDAALVIGAVPVAAPLTTPPLSTATLSTAYGLARVAAALGVSAGQLADAIAIAGYNPLASASELAKFTDLLAALTTGPVSAEAWRYLLRHEAPDLSTAELPASAVTAFLTDLHTSYDAAKAAALAPFSADGSPTENTASVLPFIAKVPGVPADTLSRMQSLLTDAWTDPATSEAAFVDTTFAGVFDTTELKAALTARAAAAAPKDAAQNAVIESLAAGVSGYLYETDRRTRLATAVATLFALEDDVAAALLQSAHLKEPPSAGVPALGELLLDDDTTAATLDLQGDGVALLHSMTKVVTKLELAAGRVSWLLERGANLGWLELDHLPYAAGQTPVALAAWQRLLDGLDLLQNYPDVVNPAAPAAPYTVSGFFDAVLTGASVADVLDYLGTLTGVDASALVALDGQLGFSTPDLAAYHDPANVQRLLTIVGLLRTLGLDVPTAVQVTAPVLTLADASSMRLALKSRYADREWLGVLKQIQDPLRELKRDALVAFLLAQNSDLAGVDDLYDYFLIDTQMSAGMSTSRIVQAHATVQLFAMRCLMGLEPKSVASIGQDDGWAQWDWMANFRVWEANRKIFLWPENWISPDLRDDKSELFDALENTLQQDALTDTAVESATDAYLAALDDIAHLDVMTAYYDTTKKVEHVFARTRGGQPYVYLHREFQQERAWTPWETVALDITGDDLLAFTRNSRLTLAWPEFTKEPDDTQDPPDTPDPAALSGGQSNSKPKHRWKIQLAVSEYADGLWREKRVSDTALYTDYQAQAYLPESHEFTMLVWSVGANQAVSCFGPNGFLGSFALTGCKGVPEAHQGGSMPAWLFPDFVDTRLESGRFEEESSSLGGELAIRMFAGQTPRQIFDSTPAGLYDVTYPLQLTIIDWIIVAIELWAMQSSGARSVDFASERRIAIPMGTLLPYFYGDYARDYAIVPGFYPRIPERKREEGGSYESEYTAVSELEYLREERYIESKKQTASDILTLIDDIVALAMKYLDKYREDPSIPLPDLVAEATADPDYKAIVEKIENLRRLRYGLQVRNFYHPLVCRFRQALNGAGVPALMDRQLQLTDTGFDFGATYQPGPEVVRPYPREDVDFELAGAYSSYNWELFFHLPFDIATRLNQDQQFDQARDWYHYVFNPVGEGDAPAPNRYWVTKPFFLNMPADYLAQRIDTIMGKIAADPVGTGIGDLAFAVSQWREEPFRPDVVARSRPVAFQMAIVINYVQNLVDWGDSLFRQFTRESVNQATQLYVLADKLLGPKPRIIPPAVPVPDMTYQQLRGEIDLFGNALLDLENLVPDLTALPEHGAELPPPPASLTSLYFCIPPNENLLAKWDLVADRLFKIRNCQNIDGVAASLALFSPPIDPGALARAVAGGMDISSFLAGLGAPPPHYRFTSMASRAGELVGHVSSLGAELLVALEKKDAEALGRLRDDQEIAVLGAVRKVKLGAIEEAEGALRGLKLSRDVIQQRIDFYSSQEYMNTWETVAVSLNGTALIGEAAVAFGNGLASGLKLVPNFMAGGAGFGGSPTVNASTGGSSIGGSAETAAKVLESLVRIAEKSAGLASTQATYQRRQDEWTQQLALAHKDAAHADQQINNGELHLSTLADDLATHDLQAKNAKALRKFMQTKYTNQELYTWMIGQVSSVYYKAYQLAFDTAKKAERGYCYELARDESFINFGYWNSMKKGLMTADALLHDLHRLQAAYLDNNVREYELTKHVSLAQLDPGALLQLRTTGKVTVSVPEVAFDLDHPSHYLRRIKTVGASLVCSAGPYTTVGMTLSLVSNKYRKATTARQGATTDKDKYAEDTGNDERFAYNVGSISSIATSSAVSDSGLFEMSFHDERYLPFEGAGAVSTWQIELPTTHPQFDHDSITDLILHFRYTAREGGSTFKALTEKALSAMMNDTLLVAGRQGLYVGYSLRDTFPNEWWQLQETGTTTINVDASHLPFVARSHSPQLTSCTWAAQVTGSPASYAFSVDGVASTLNRDSTMKSLCTGSVGAPVLGTPIVIACDASKLVDLTVLVGYKIS